MHRRRILLALAAGLLVLPAAGEARSPFWGSTWRLVSITADGRTTSPPPARGGPHLLTFEGGNEFVSSICNNQDGKLLRIGPVYSVAEKYSTLMACSGPLGVADDVVGSGWPTLWSVRGDVLHLRNKHGSLTFVRHLTPAQP